MADKETVSDWGIHLSRHLQVLSTSFPDHFPPDRVAELKRDCFYGRLPKQLKVMVPYLKAGLLVRTYSDYLRAAREAEKEDSAVHLAHLEEEDAGDDEDQESDDPSGIEGVTKEFMVHLARAVKDTQADEKCCYHCSSPEHFICNCLLVKTSSDKKQLNGKEAMALMKGAKTPQTMTSAMKNPQTDNPKV